jgi:epoxyqueuosine reductase QueG
MDLRGEIIQKIKNHVAKANIEGLFREPLVGFASAKDPDYLRIKEVVGDFHLYPTDILPEAETVIAFFIPFDERIVESNKAKKETSFEWAYCYIKTNALINEISEELVNWFEGKGIKGAMVRATHTYDAEKLVASWSHRSAAYIAGLGTFGINRLLISDVGCAGRYGSVVISEYIEPSQRPKVDKCIQLNGEKCLECIKNCPTHALGINKIDRHKCNDHLLKVDGSFPELETCDVCGKCSIGPCATIINNYYCL